MYFCIFYDTDQVKGRNNNKITIKTQMPTIVLLNPGKEDFFLNSKTEEDRLFWEERAFVYQMSNNI
jgi:hypothetical protein